MGAHRHCTVAHCSWHRRYKVSKPALLRWKRRPLQNQPVAPQRKWRTGLLATLHQEVLRPYLHQLLCTQPAPSWCTAMVTTNLVPNQIWCTTCTSWLTHGSQGWGSTVTDHQHFFFLRTFALGPKLLTANMSTWWGRLL